MSLLLSVLVPSWSGRVRELMPRIVGQLHDQIGDSTEVELLCLVDNGLMSIGRKMRLLTDMARGEYIVGVGDDDTVTDDYVAAICLAIRENPGVDVVCFDHDYFVDGEFQATIIEGIAHPYRNDYGAKIYTRSPSNKMAIRRDHCFGFDYPDLWHGEDRDFAKWVLPKLRTEARIDRVLYNYLYRGGNKNERRALEKKAKCLKLT